MREKDTEQKFTIIKVFNKNTVGTDEARISMLLKYLLSNNLVSFKKVLAALTKKELITCYYPVEDKPGSSIIHHIITHTINSGCEDFLDAVLAEDIRLEQWNASHSLLEIALSCHPFVIERDTSLQYDDQARLLESRIHSVCKKLIQHGVMIRDKQSEFLDLAVATGSWKICQTIVDQPFITKTINKTYKAGNTALHILATYFIFYALAQLNIPMEARESEMLNFLQLYLTDGAEVVAIDFPDLKEKLENDFKNPYLLLLKIFLDKSADLHISNNYSISALEYYLAINNYHLNKIILEHLKKINDFDKLYDHAEITIYRQHPMAKSLLSIIIEKFARQGNIEQNSLLLSLIIRFGNKDFLNQSKELMQLGINWHFKIYNYTLIEELILLNHDDINQFLFDFCSNLPVAILVPIYIEMSRHQFIFTEKLGNLLLDRLKKSEKREDINLLLQVALFQFPNLVSEIISDGANVNWKNRNNDLAIFLTIESQNQESLALLLANNVDINVTNNNNENVLLYALKKKNILALDILAQNFVQHDINLISSANQNPFCFLVQNYNANDIIMLKTLISSMRPLLTHSDNHICALILPFFSYAASCNEIRHIYNFYTLIKINSDFSEEQKYKILNAAVHYIGLKNKKSNTYKQLVSEKKTLTQEESTSTKEHSWSYPSYSQDSEKEKSCTSKDRRLLRQDAKLKSNPKRKDSESPEVGTSTNTKNPSFFDKPSQESKLNVPIWCSEAIRFESGSSEVLKFEGSNDHNLYLWFPRGYLETKYNCPTDHFNLSNLTMTGSNNVQRINKNITQEIEIDGKTYQTELTHEMRPRATKDQKRNKERIFLFKLENQEIAGLQQATLYIALSYNKTGLHNLRDNRSLKASTMATTEPIKLTEYLPQFEKQKSSACTSTST